MIQKWAGQVLHVVWKDVRMSRTFIATIVLMYAAAGMAITRGTTPVVVLAAWLASNLFVAILIQGDSPYRSDALWRGKPLYPGAVFAAKLLVMGTIVTAFPLALHAATLLVGYGAVPPGLFEQLVGSAVLVTGSALGAAVYAAITPNFRTFFLVLAGEYVFANMIGAWRVNSGGRDAGYAVATPLTSITLVSVVLPFVIVGWVYHSRNRAHGIALAPVAFLVPMLLSFGAIDLDSGKNSTLPPNETAGRLVAEIPAASSAPRRDNAHSLRAKEFNILLGLRDFDPSRSYRLVAPTAELVYADGHSESARVMRRMVNLNDAVPKVPTAEWLEIGWWPPFRKPNQPDPRHRTEVPIDLTQAEQSAVNSGRARLVIRGKFQVNELALVTTMPLDSGRVVTHQGERIEIVGINRIGNQLTVKVRGIDLSTDRRTDFSPHEPEFAILNRARGELIPLLNWSGGSGMYGILPARIHNNAYERELSISRPDRQLEVSESWFEGVELVRFRKRFLGSYRVITEAVPEPRPTPN